MTKKIHILKEEYQPNYYPLGLVSHLGLLPLSTSLNNSLNFSFHILEPILNNTNDEFPCSMHLEIDESFMCYLIKNKNEGHVLFSAYKQIDYILVLIGFNSKENYSHIPQKLKKTTALSTELELKKLKGLSKMLFK